MFRRNSHWAYGWGGGVCAGDGVQYIGEAYGWGGGVCAGDGVQYIGEALRGCSGET